MNTSIKEWLLEESTPEMRLRILKEGLGYMDDSPEVITTKERLFQSKTFQSVVKKLHSDKKWTVYDAFLALAEWGCTRNDLGQELDDVVEQFLSENGFQILCGEPVLLRNLVKLGYWTDPRIQEEVKKQFALIKEDGGFGCISTNKKINDPKKTHKSCTRYTAGFLMLAAEMNLQHIEVPNQEKLMNYYIKRNIFYRMDDPKQPMVDVMMETFFPADPIKIGVQYLIYSLKMLGGISESEAMQEGYRVIDRYRMEDGKYMLSGTKSVPAFKSGKINEANKWITFYAYRAKGEL